MSRQLNHTLKVSADLTLDDFIVPVSKRLLQRGEASVKDVELEPIMERPLLVSAQDSVILSG